MQCLRVEPTSRDFVLQLDSVWFVHTAAAVSFVGSEDLDTCTSGCFGFQCEKSL